ncbi:MAG: threonylcarbamoyl-AMP synthase [Calditrichaeota bacterium]|nr:threonylcarbamoyl-AMP synthase [Calditrichota bacterium]RQV99095.1 MAG: threonylcarbamoyl-AMP synthase [Calditrichota bacterium]
MNIIKVDQLQPDHSSVIAAADLLLQGMPILHPTETVYGLAGLYNNMYAIRRLNELKSRTPGQPYSIMVNKVEEMLDMSGVQSIWLKKVLNRIFPGALTILIPRKKKLDLPYWNQFKKIGFRLPDHPLCNQLLQEVGTPIITTSANRSGDRPAVSVNDLPPEFLEKIPLILDGGPTISRKPSTIIEMNDDFFSFHLIREGAIPWQVLEKMIADS